MSVRVEPFAEHVALVTLDRPERRNAIDANTADALFAAVAATEADPAVRVVVLTGAGTAFCAGADLTGHASSSFRLRGPAEGGFAGFVLARRSKPWIAAVNGPAVAGGMEIVLACDTAVAAAVARFGLPEVKRGLLATGGGVQRLPRAVPRAIALRMILTGETIEAAAALHWGLVSAVVDGDALLDTVCELATAIAANAPRAVRESLAVARQAPFLDQAAVDELARAARDRVLASPDAREGARAFLERRTPRWAG